MKPNKATCNTVSSLIFNHVLAQARLKPKTFQRKLRRFRSFACGGEKSEKCSRPSFSYRLIGYTCKRRSPRCPCRVLSNSLSDHRVSFLSSLAAPACVDGGNFCAVMGVASLITDLRQTRLRRQLIIRNRLICLIISHIDR